MNNESFDDNKTRTHTVLTQGIKIGRYRIEKQIGAGGMGEVYLAEDTELNRQVALKFLPLHLCKDEDCRARFKREAQAAAKLDHPNIVAVHEVSEYQGRPFFSMQLVEGQSLREVIKGKDLPVERIVEMATQICEGLQAAHEKGITHRDIKPANMLVDDRGRVRIVDFGLASVVGSDQLTKTGSTLGTVGYMSPEQVQGKEVDHRSDLFSLGVILYEMLTGRAPFKSETEAATLNSVINDNPEPLSRFKSSVPDALQNIVSKLLEKNPSYRYQSAAGVISDLKRLSAGTSPLVKKGPADWWNRFVVTGAVLVILVIVVYWMWPHRPSGEGEKIKSLVVLPFENLGTENDEYFADGMTDEITARLAGFSGLRVISRTSAVHYKDSGKPLKEIARELKVDYVLEGTVRWDKSGDTDRVRIIPQLIRASDDSHVWTNTFERTLTQVFAVQADIATRIAEALDVTLLETEKQLLAAKPIENLEAYDFYLRGKKYWEQGKDSEPAIRMFERAVELDSNFFQAYAWLPRLYGFEYINDYNMTRERVVKAEEAAEKAFRLADGKPDGYLAMGYYYYYFSRDYDRALEFFSKALQGQPNNSELIAAIAYVQRRMGNWDAAVDNLKKANSLNPFSPTEIDGLIFTLMHLHRLREAESLVNKALKLWPDNNVLHLYNAALIFYSRMDTHQDTLEVAKAMHKYEQLAPAPQAAIFLEMVDILQRDYQNALGRRSIPRSPTAGDSASFYIQRGYIYRFMGDSGISRTYFNSARIICERRLKTEPELALIHANLAQIYAAIGKKQKAVREGELAAELLPVSKDVIQGTSVLQSLSIVYIMVGKYDLAIDQLDYLLSHPSRVQIATLRSHPVYDPLRDHPRFKALLEKYEKEDYGT